MPEIHEEFKKLREKRKIDNKKYQKILDIVEKAEIFEQKGNFFDAADLFEKAAQNAGEIGDEELHNQLLNKIEECMIKGEEKRDKLDKMFSI